MTSTNERLEKLQATIRNIAAEPSRTDKFIAMASVFNCLGINFEVVMSHTLNHIEGKEDAGIELTKLLQTMLAKDIFNKQHKYAANAQELASYLDTCEGSIYFEIEALIFAEDINSRAIKDNFEELKRKKRKATDHDKLYAIFQEFAVENFYACSITQRLINGLPPQIGSHLMEVGLNHIPGRFAWQKFNILEMQSGGALHNNGFIGNGLDYEHHIAELISRNAPNANVQVTKSSGDQGADIIVTVNTHKVVIQTKLYSSPVGNSAVQQIYAAKRHYCATAAVVVTNSSYTKSAHELAESLQVTLLHEDDVGPLFSRAFS